MYSKITASFNSYCC